MNSSKKGESPRKKAYSAGGFVAQKCPSEVVMPAPIAFGAKTTRENNYVGVIKNDSGDLDHLGPGYYHTRSTLAKHKPSYVESVNICPFTWRLGHRKIARAKTLLIFPAENFVILRCLALIRPRAMSIVMNL